MNNKLIKCVHCLKEIEKSSKDHVFPKSWYTDNTPSHIQRLTVPSCIDCNNKFGKLEEELFIALAGCVDPKQAEASGINFKFKRALGIERGNLTRYEQVIRKRKAQKLLKKFVPYDSIRTKPFPGLGPHEGYPSDKQMAMPVPKELIPVLEKIFRGLEYKLNNKKYIGHPYVLKVYHVDEEPPELERLFNSFGKKEEFGPGFKVQRASAVEDEEVVIYKSIIWGKLESYASIMVE